LHETACRCYF